MYGNPHPPKIGKNLIKSFSELSLKLKKSILLTFLMFEEPAIINKKIYTHPTKTILFVTQLVKGSMFHWEQNLVLNMIFFPNSAFLTDFCVQLEILPHLLARKY